MKVCFATYDAFSDVGGVSTWLRRLLPLLQSANIELEVHVMAIGGEPGVNCAAFEKQGIRVRWIPFQWHLPQAVRSLVQLVKESQPDIYVPNCIIPAYYAGKYVRLSGIPTVGILHSDDLFHWGIVDEFIIGYPDFRVSVVVPVSRFLESRIASIAEGRRVMVRRIGYGVPIPQRAAERANKVFRLVYIGRLVEKQKRISDVTEALCRVATRLPDLEAWIVGEGPAREAVEKIICQSGVGNRVQLLAGVDNANIYGVLVQCHCLVLLSDYEGLPISVLEGMATGLVPICLDTRSGIREAILHGINGLIVKDRGPDFFAAVTDLHSNRAWWQQMSAAARDTARWHYSIDRCARQWIDLLYELDMQRSGRTVLRAPRPLRLPPPNPKFGAQGASVPWTKRLEEYVRSKPPAHRVARSIAALGRKFTRSSIETIL
jgi:colanic acid/amylovoran biosynthesis glycosyltransferase